MSNAFSEGKVPDFMFNVGFVILSVGFAALTPVALGWLFEKCNDFFAWCESITRSKPDVATQEPAHVPIRGIYDFDELVSFVQMKLCQKANLVLEQTRIFYRPLLYRCGFQFTVQGPPQVRLGAVWSSIHNDIYFYDTHGNRYYKERLYATVPENKWLAVDEHEGFEDDLDDDDLDDDDLDDDDLDDDDLDDELDDDELDDDLDDDNPEHDDNSDEHQTVDISKLPDETAARSPTQQKVFETARTLAAKMAFDKRMQELRKGTTNSENDATPKLTISSATINEGDGGTVDVIFTVKLSLNALIANSKGIGTILDND